MGQLMQEDTGTVERDMSWDSDSDLGHSSGPGEEDNSQTDGKMVIIFEWNNDGSTFRKEVLLDEALTLADDELDLDGEGTLRFRQLADGEARADLLDCCMLASSTSSSESGEESHEYQHLHRLQKNRRQKRAANRERCIVRYIPPVRPSIIGRRDFFFRFGEQEREAVASFDFLEDLSTSASDLASSVDDNRIVPPEAESRENTWALGDSPRDNLTKRIDVTPELVTDCQSCDGTQQDDVIELSLLTLHSGDGENIDRLSLSDSCAESFSSSSQSLDT